MATSIFVVGAAKCGTTSLCSFLTASTQVSSCYIKEPNHFCDDFHPNIPNARYNYLNTITNREQIHPGDRHAAFVPDRQLYLQLFEPGKIPLDCSTNYIYSTSAAEQIKQFDPNAKIIITIREPITRAFSHYGMDLRTGVKLEGFVEEIKKEINNLDTVEWHNSPILISRSIYYPQIKRYLDAFGPDQIKIVLFEDLIGDNKQLALQSICDFIGIPTPNNDLQKENTQIQPRFQKLNQMLFDSGLKGLARDLLPTALKEQIKSFYYQDKRLQLTEEDRSTLKNMPDLQRLLQQDREQLFNLGIEPNWD